ncbi:hypothetical protein GTP46_13140 [Duganella sp. FT135W]|uniref:Uncharacterized protein n=1 Tax=Duganella flavida TaxID=2692175 RepID=A0A6L8K820_9BURK|nr:DUF4369 domain-containing protein [Duganella flavida]MYM23593.1 hypothetical protein [Duganella flavida]
MKFSFVSAAVALAAVAALAGCGGKAEFTVQGNLTDSSGNLLPLANSGLVLANGSDTVTVPAGATSFAFPKQIPYGTDYNITIKNPPDHMNCAVSGASGSAGHNVAIRAAVICAQNEYTLGGQFTGLTAAADGTARTVTLLNGSTSTALISSAAATNGAGDFTFSATVKDGTAYGVTVLDPNNGLSCSIANGTGVMHATAVTNLLVTCVPK